MAVTQIIGPRIAPLWADPAEWTSTRAYEPFTFVTYQGDSYCSRQDTPIGIQITNYDYWVKVSDYNAQAVALQRSMTQTIETAETNMENTIQNAKNDMTAQVNETKAVANELSGKTAQIQSNTEILARISSFSLEANRKYWQSKMIDRYVAHQGAYTSAPGNTEPAFEIACRCMFQVIECDVWKTSDGVYVLSHSGNTSEMTDTNYDINSITYAQFSNLVITKGDKVERYPNLHYCTLERYLQICARNNVIPMIEDKCNDPYGICAYAQARVGNNFIYINSSMNDCKNAQQAYHEIGVGLIASSAPTETVLQEAYEAGFFEITVMATALTEAVVKSIHSHNMLVGAWNTDTNNTVKTMRNIGVDVINLNGHIFTNNSTNNTVDDAEAVGSYKGIAAYSDFTLMLARNHMCQNITGAITANMYDFDTHEWTNGDVVTPLGNYMIDYKVTQTPVFVQIEDNDYYEYFVRRISNTNLGKDLIATPHLKAGEIYYLFKYINPGRTVDNEQIFSIGASLKTNQRFGDIDLLEMHRFAKFVDIPNFPFYQAPTFAYAQQPTLSRTDLVSIPLRQRNLKYDATDTNATYRILGFNAEGALSEQSDLLTDSGTYTATNSETTTLQYRISVPSTRAANMPDQGLPLSAISRFCSQLAFLPYNPQS